MDADKQEINFLELIFTDEIFRGKIYEILVRETNLHAQDRREVGSKMENSLPKKKLNPILIIVKLSETRIYLAKDNFFGNFAICTPGGAFPYWVILGMCGQNG